jgi:hypothetical protein
LIIFSSFLGSLPVLESDSGEGVADLDLLQERINDAVNTRLCVVCRRRLGGGVPFEQDAVHSSIHSSMGLVFSMACEWLSDGGLSGSYLSHSECKEGRMCNQGNERREERMEDKEEEEEEEEEECEPRTTPTFFFFFLLSNPTLNLSELRARAITAEIGRLARVPSPRARAKVQLEP